MWSYNYGYLCHGMNDYLEHHGILGQKWGIRRFQNPDGSLTPEGRIRYGLSDKDRDTLVKEWHNKRASNISPGSKFYRTVMKNKAVKEQVKKMVNKYKDQYIKIGKKYQKADENDDENILDDLDLKIINLYSKYQDENDKFMDNLYGKNGQVPAYETKDSSGNVVYSYKLSRAASNVLDDAVWRKLHSIYDNGAMI